jgi:mono/diheme cytochrome c family protein
MLLALALCLLTTGCQQKMARQPAYRPLQESDFFADNRAARPLVAGTIARGHLQSDTQFFTGRRSPYGAEAHAVAVVGSGSPFGTAATALVQGQFVDTFPLPVTEEVLQRGRERFTIFCTPCHDRLGTGNGKIVQRGFTKPPSYHELRLRQAPAGYFFDVITHGHGAMPDYASQVPPRDRWAIVGYIRALQLSQHATLQDVPEEERKRLSEGGRP